VNGSGNTDSRISAISSLGQPVKPAARRSASDISISIAVSDDFGLCGTRAHELAQTFVKNGKKPILRYGLFHAGAPVSRWDDRWRVNNIDPIFTHCWVEVDHFIYDNSAEQFGEAEFIKALTTDPRYQVVGYIDLNTGERHPVVEYPKIVWTTLQDRVGNGAQSVMVIMAQDNRISERQAS
jgi:hypothetical protein